MENISVAVDVMGGDFAPAEPVAGAVQAAREQGIDVLLVGDSDIRAWKYVHHPLVYLSPAKDYLEALFGLDGVLAAKLVARTRALPLVQEPALHAVPGATADPDYARLGSRG